MPLLYHNNNSISNVTSFAQVPSGSLTLLSTATASSSSSISFTSGIDSTYDVYCFEYINCHPSTVADFQFNMSTDNGSNYNVTKTTTFFSAMHSENDSVASLAYSLGNDLAQSTAYQTLCYVVNTNSDDCVSGKLFLYNPSSTTYVKHFMTISQGVVVDGIVLSLNPYVAGYGNTTSAVNAIRFQMSSGNIDAGTIKMYGIK